MAKTTRGMDTFKTSHQLSSQATINFTEVPKMTPSELVAWARCVHVESAVNMGTSTMIIAKHVLEQLSESDSS